MHHLELSDGELDVLTRLLDYYIPDLRGEITRTEAQPLRNRLKGDEAMLTQLLNRLSRLRPLR